MQAYRLIILFVLTSAILVVCAPITIVPVTKIEPTPVAKDQPEPSPTVFDQPVTPYGQKIGSY